MRYWHGTQGGRVALAERQLRVEKPRLRKRQAASGERAEVARIEAEYDPHSIRLDKVSVKPRKSDIAVEDLALVWSA